VAAGRKQRLKIKLQPRWRCWLAPGNRSLAESLAPGEIAGSAQLSRLWLWGLAEERKRMTEMTALEGRLSCYNHNEVV